MYHIVLVALLEFSAAYGNQSYKELTPINHPISEAYYSDPLTNQPLLGFKQVNTDNLVVDFPVKIDITQTGKRLTKLLRDYAKNNVTTTHYKRSLTQIEDYFFDVQGLLQTHRPRQIKLLMESCQIIDRAASRFLNEMGGNTYEVKEWKIFKKPS